MDNRAGTYTNNLHGEMAYKSFSPAPLPPNPPINIDEEMVNLLVDANKQVAILEESATLIPNVNLFVSMYVRKEALMSSQIEGTQATLEDILDPMINENTNRNVSDVVNYVNATEYALLRRLELPLCNRLIKETHAVLMKDVRGQEKNPGEFRASQNWIGGVGSTLQTARYIPPSVPDMINAMSDLEKYYHVDDSMDNIIKSALIHYQFETIHPFLDGNGRVGRLLITLFLMEKNVLTTPALYISYYLKQNRIEYYDRLSEVRRNGNYEQWIKFFLKAVAVSANDAVINIKKLSELHDRNVALIEKMERKEKITMQLFTYLESNPIIEIKKTASSLDVAYNTASSAINRLVDAGILVQSNDNMRNKVFSYTDYLDILRGGTE